MVVGAAMAFELLDHPADIGFRVHGGSLPELFANAAAALLAIACEPDSAGAGREYRLETAGADYESLLVNWLNEVLYWFDGKQILLRGFRIARLDERSLEAACLGEPRESGRHRSRLIVKAVTYHQLRIAREDGGWMAEVYVDI